MWINKMNKQLWFTGRLKKESKTEYEWVEHRTYTSNNRASTFEESLALGEKTSILEQSMPIVAYKQNYYILDGKHMEHDGHKFFFGTIAKTPALNRYEKCAVRRKDCLPLTEAAVEILMRG